MVMVLCALGQDQVAKPFWLIFQRGAGGGKAPVNYRPYCPLKDGSRFWTKASIPS